MFLLVRGVGVREGSLYGFCVKCFYESGVKVFVSPVEIWSYSARRPMPEVPECFVYPRVIFIVKCPRFTNRIGNRPLGE